MELLDGPTLRRLLQAERSRRQGPSGSWAAWWTPWRRPTDDASSTGPQAENVILARGETGEVPKVLDFGLARLLPGDAVSEGDTATRRVAGTRATWPRAVGGRGRRPIVGPLGSLRHGVRDAHRNASLRRRPRRLARGPRRRALPPVKLHPAAGASRLDTLFSQAFAPRPGDRPASAGSLLADLRDALAIRTGPNRMASGEQA